MKIIGLVIVLLGFIVMALVFSGAAGQTIEQEWASLVASICIVFFGLLWMALLGRPSKQELAEPEAKVPEITMPPSDISEQARLNSGMTIVDMRRRETGQLGQETLAGSGWPQQPSFSLLLCKHCRTAVLEDEPFCINCGQSNSEPVVS